MAEGEGIVEEALKKPMIQMFGIWGYRMILLLCVIAGLWSQQHFVQMEVYGKDRDSIHAALDEFRLILNTMQERDKVNDRQDKQLEDHENRVRILERICIEKNK